MPRSTDAPLAPHSLFKLYWGYILPNLCELLEIYPSERIKLQLHEEFKNYLGYIHTAGLTETEYRLFLFEVLATCSVELGLFVRSSTKQPENIAEMDLCDAWEYL